MEIKFRAWDKENEVMIYPKGILFDGRVVNFSCGILEPFEGCELMQYTGLKDKNGKEIYEGDLLTDYGEAPPLYVEYSEKHGAYCFVDKFDPSGTVYYTPLMIYYEQMEVIGNIYANPELLEVAK
ncbi:YopX family protein [Aeribacillus composti]|uniref:YopX family protein n=1 Tax=Aeribacillus composti TaxID=1868734 RepID=UPI00406AAFC7